MSVKQQPTIPAGFNLASKSFNVNGDEMADFTAEVVPGSKLWKKGSDGVFDQFATIKMRAERDGQTVENTVEVSWSDWESDPNSVIAKIAPRNSRFDNTGNQLKRAIELAGTHPHLFPKRDAEDWRDETGEYHLGKRQTTLPITITQQFKDEQTGEERFRLLCRGHRIVVTRDELVSGGYAYKIPGLQILDPIGLTIRLTKEWKTRTEAEKLQMIRDEHLEHIEAINQKLAKLGGR